MTNNNKEHIMSIQTKQKLLVDHPQMDMIIKRVRLFEKGGKIHLDYRLNHLYKKDSKDRVRFSTGEVHTRRAMQRIERDKYALALAHYLENTQVMDGANMTLGDIALDAISEGKGNRQADSHNDYLMIYDIYIKPIFEHTILTDIKVSHLRSWKNDLLEVHPMSQARFVKYLRVLNFIFKYAFENEMIDRNPVLLVDKKSKLFKKSKTKQEEKYYTATEVKKMLSKATGWFRVMLVTYLNTGIRTGEGLALKKSDIDFEKMTIVIQRSMRKGKVKEGTKTGEDRIIRMSQPLKDELLAYMEFCTSDTWLFPNIKTGLPYYEANSITKYYFKPLLEICGIKYKTFYALRHSFASLSIQKNIPMSVIQQQLGHKKLSTTLDFYVKHDLLAEKNDIDIFDKLYA